jgi:5-hydroxyisourate hydrolase
MMSISTHVLDTSSGAPAAGVEVTLTAVMGAREIARGLTDEDGRLSPLVAAATPGTYELRFFVRPYFDLRGVASFYDEISVRFTIHDASQHYHVPLLLSPWGYSTYRGS